MAEHDADTIENIAPVVAAAKYFVEPTEGLAFDFGAASHTGLKRSENQDHYVVMRRTRTQQLLLTNMPTEELVLPADVAYGMAVADGMGGGGCGELASRLAIRTAWELAGRTTSWLMKIASLNTNELSERIEGFVYMMQQAFIHEFHENPNFCGSGTTWTSAYFVSSFAILAQIGDSPAFLWRDGTFSRVTTDHTIEQEFITAGVKPEIAGKYSHMLTRCLGYDTQAVRPDIYHLRLRPGDQLLLCTDGVTDMVTESHIAECLDVSSTAQGACDGLISLALAAGGRDNVTAVLARAKQR
jgi:serine/threonine protein phosphatase PrpC